MILVLDVFILRIVSSYDIRSSNIIELIVYGKHHFRELPPQPFVAQSTVAITRELLVLNLSGTRRPSRSVSMEHEGFL